MSLNKLNQKAVSGKLKMIDYVGAVVSVIVAIYFYTTTGMSSTTMWASGFAVIAILFAILNPAKRLNDMIVKKQTGQY